MPITINPRVAQQILREEADAVSAGEPIDQAWRRKIEALSSLCEEPGSSRTHIAFLAVQLLAKAVEPRVDLYAIKPDHAPGNTRAFSARTLCHGVIVPLSVELGFHLGVTGREPLNNQPYFRMTRLGDGTPVRASAKPAFDYTIALVDELDAITDAEVARRALRAFIAVRREFMSKDVSHAAQVMLTPPALIQAIARFVGEDSEGGRRAQAIVAALFDVALGEELIESGRIHDPSRRSPGDVCVRSAIAQDQWEKAVEVRDKPVTRSDLVVFGRRCAQLKIRDVSVVAVSDKQGPLDLDELEAWSRPLGLSFTLFMGWESLVHQALFWAKDSKHTAAARAVEQVHRRLIALEVSVQGVKRWSELVVEHSDREV